jgi:hypothetical protein
VKIGEVFADAWRIYKRLLRRSIVVAGLIFTLVALADALAARSNTQLTRLVAVGLGLVGGLLVQGALVEVVRDLHEGRPVRSIGAVYDSTRGRLGTLLGASLLYGIGVVIGLFLLLIPGLIAAARWSLIVPLVMIERLGWREAFARSSALVKGQTGRVLVVNLLSNILSGVASIALATLFIGLPSFFGNWIGGAIAGALVVPFGAHVLTVLYYKLTEPERPVLADTGTRRDWQSIWHEPEDKQD